MGDRYQQLRADHDGAVPSFFNFGTDVVDAWAREPDRLALVWCNADGAERRFSYGDMARLTDRFAAALRRRGVGKGDRVLVMLPRTPEWQIAMVAVLKLGAVAVPCITMLTPKDIEHRLVNSGASTVITTAADSAKLDGLAEYLLRVVVGERADWQGFDALLAEDGAGFVAETVAAEDPALIYYTSGSTGTPKGVTHASRALYTWRGSARDWLDLTAEDMMFCTADTGWSKAGTSILFGPWSQGSSVLFYDGPFEPEKRLELIARHGVTVYCASATELRHMVGLDPDPATLSRLRLTVSAGESLNPPVLARWRQLTGAPVLEAYGLTETLMLIANYRDTEVRGGSMGRPLPGVEIDLLDDEGVVTEPGAVGQIALRLPSPHFMLGYWNDPERTAAGQRIVDEQLYFLTNDNATTDGDGYLYYEGRADDVINSAGYRIGPQEVENALMAHPAVKEVAAVPSPDSERGEVVKAFIVLHPGYSGSAELVLELQNFAKRQTAPYKYPRRIAFVPDLPKSVVGKVQRKLLKQQEWQAASAAEVRP